MDIVATILGIFQAIVGFILVLFIPGYALCWALYPTRDQLTLMGRMAISLTLSLSAVILTVLFIDLVLGISTTPVNIAISLIILTGIAALIWKMEILYPKWALKQKFEGKTKKYVNIVATRTARLRSALIGQQQKLQRFLAPVMNEHEEQ